MSKPEPGAPPRTPVICGALGRYDRDLVARIARALDVPLAEVHRDRSSLLLADREPLRWRHRLTRGLCWSEGLAVSARGVRSWREAATELDAFGLFISPRARLLHTSVAGAVPIYWRDHGDATYFASTIDALARGLPGPLHTDWDAWAAIFTLRLPMTDRTPFAEIRRLPPFASVHNDGKGGHVRRPPWPWAELELDRDPHEGGVAIFEEIVTALEPLRATGATVTLSGGHDSRVLLSAALEAGVPTRAVTMNLDDGSGHEAELAAQIAAAAGAEHEIVNLSEPERYLEFWQERLLACDFQFINNAWVMPLGERLRELGAPVLDGYTLDVWAASGKKFYTPEMLAPEAGRAEMLQLWRGLCGAMGNAHRRAFGPGLGRQFERRSRREYLRSSRPLLDSPNRALLIHYVTRTVRAVSAVSVQALGRHAHVLTPASWNRVASIALAIPPPLKHGGAMYDALFERSGPVGRVPSTWEWTGTPRRQHAQLRFSEPMIGFYEQKLREGPLTPWLRGPLGERLAAGELAQAVRRPAMHRATMAVTSFHLWAQRYSEQLVEPDPSELLEGGEEDERPEAAAFTPG